MIVEPSVMLDPEDRSAFDQCHAELLEHGIRLFKLPICQALSALNELGPISPYPDATPVVGWYSKPMIKLHIEVPRGFVYYEAWEAALQWLLEQSWVEQHLDFEAIGGFSFRLTAEGLARYLENAVSPSHT